MQLAIKQVAENQKQIYTRMIAKSALAGLVQLLPKYRESAGQIVKHITAVTCPKLVRRLCDNCKVGFEPSTATAEATGHSCGQSRDAVQAIYPTTD